MRSRAYEVVHVLPGRVRIVIASSLSAGFASHLSRLEASRAIHKVIWNPITRSVVVEYAAANLELSEVVLVFDQIFAEMGYKVGGQNCSNDLFWSLLAGGAIALAFALRRVTPNSGAASMLETAAFGITAYSVVTHCGGQNSSSKALHLDSIAGLVSVLNLGSNRAFAGLFMTWLFNFMEIIGWTPLKNRQGSGTSSFRCGLTNY
ncbi:hypothetical protein [Pelosinus propionicus]|uniref:Uncharacterized protein n=1 Tax=Pelosinus propionicus DSM 13327 TaxID=1123291 RepID=A0A1I4I7J2_9FIRM|nr:hypothetical protein [Pelosinus propionicus]SFL50388.1 hypothetical protein SAMN04490355_100712 [Pelosinus propionicus DSM 13327]